MITLIRLLRNIGQFDSVTQGSSLPLARLTLIYAENGRGKTTLAAVLRSLATGNAISIAERARLASTHPPHAIVEFDGTQPAAMFQNNAWNNSAPNLVVFDDTFVDENICSGLEVAANHRQKLHELILGARGVSLNRTLQDHVLRIEQHNRDLRSKADAIPAIVRGPFAVDAFCNLQSTANIEAQIETVERQLAAAKQQEPIRSTPPFEAFSLPELNLEPITTLLRRDLPSLDAAAAQQVQQHFNTLGQSGEEWVAAGFRRSSANRSNTCPFCTQDLGPSQIIGHYRAYFSQAYATLKTDISAAISSFTRLHGDESPAAFERAIRVCGERRQFWARFCEIPEVAVDTAAIARVWRAAREGILAELHRKQASPLEARQLPEAVQTAAAAYGTDRNTIAALNNTLQAATTAINVVKEQAAAGNLSALESDLARLKAIQARFSPEITAKCAEYLQEKQAKAATEGLRNQAKEDLKQYRESVFPVYQNAINDYLRKFNASFRLGSVEAADTRGGPTCNYCVVVNNVSVAVATGTSAAGTPSFRTILSSGDRNTLALAFFFASLDQDAAIADKTVVIDDPISSLDDHRSLTTVQEIRRLLQRCSQVIVLSHSKPFLCRLSEHPNPTIVTAIQVTREGTGSTLSNWDVSQDCITEHDRRHAMLREYTVRSNGNDREVAKAIRPIIEAFCRVAFPEHFPPGTLLGPFRGLCEQGVGTPNEILDQQDTQELRELVEFANRFHHDTNPAWETELINDAELLGFVQRVLDFTSR
jgi:wobble nucleotide-excising tRNase